MFFCDGISFEAFSASKRNKFTVHVKTESLDLEVKPWMLCGDAFSCLYVETMPEDVLGMRLTMKEVMNGSISDPELSYIPLYLTQITVSEPLEIQYCLTVANNFVLGLALLRGSATKYALRPMVLFNKEEDGFYIDSTFKCSYSFQDMFFYVRDLYSAQGRLYASTILKELCSSNFIKNLFTCLETNEDLSDLADVLSHQPVLPSKNAVLLFSCFEKIFKHLPDALKRSKALYDFFAKKAEQERDTHFEQNYEGEANIFKSYAKSFQTLKSKIKDGEKLNRFTGSKVDQYDEKRQTNFPDRLKLAIPFIVSDTNGTYYSLISYQDLKIMNLRNDLVHANTSPDKSLSQQFVFTDDKNGLFVATEKAQMFIELYMKSLGAMLLLHMCGYQGPVCRMERMFEICKDRSGHEEEGEPYPDIQKLKDRSIYSPYVYIDGCKDCGVSTSTLAREEEL